MDLYKINIINQKSDIKFDRLKYSIIKKKGKIKYFSIKDGFLNLKINPKDLYCNFCKKKYCKHTNYILYDYFKIDYNLIPVLKIKDFDFNLDTFYQDIENYFKNYECCICLGNKLVDFWMCDHCNQIIHNKCMIKWTIKSNECPLCKERIFKSL